MEKRRDRLRLSVNIEFAVSLVAYESAHLLTFMEDPMRLSKENRSN